MTRHPGPVQPQTAGSVETHSGAVDGSNGPYGSLDLSGDSELEELIEQVRQVPGPTPEQIAELDRALEPFLGTWPPGPETQQADSSDAHPGEGSGNEKDLLNPHGEGPGLTATGAGLGKVIGALGAAVLAGAALWGASLMGQTAHPDAPDTAGNADVTLPALTSDAPSPKAIREGASVSSESQTEATDEENLPATPAAEKPDTLEPGASNDATSARPKAKQRASSTKQLARAQSSKTTQKKTQKGAERTKYDWTEELARLQRAEKAIKRGAIASALAEIEGGSFKELHSNAQALKAAALCKGTPAQQRQGAQLARELSKNARTATLVRRLKGCMNGD